MRPTNSAAKAPAVRKIIPLPPTKLKQVIGINHEQGTFKTIGRKNHQPVDAPIFPETSRIQRLTPARGWAGGSSWDQPCLRSLKTCLARRKQSTPTGMPQ